MSVRCGGNAVVKKARRQGRKRWGTRIALKGRCANASKAKLRVRYPGGGDFRIAVRKRNNVKLNPGGS